MCTQIDRGELIPGDGKVFLRDAEAGRVRSVDQGMHVAILKELDGQVEFLGQVATVSTVEGELGVDLALLCGINGHLVRVNRVMEVAQALLPLLIDLELSGTAAEFSTTQAVQGGVVACDIVVCSSREAEQRNNFCSKHIYYRVINLVTNTSL